MQAIFDAINSNGLTLIVAVVVAVFAAGALAEKLSK